MESDGNEAKDILDEERRSNPGIVPDEVQTLVINLIRLHGQNPEMFRLLIVAERASRLLIRASPTRSMEITDMLVELERNHRDDIAWVREHAGFNGYKEFSQRVEARLNDDMPYEDAAKIFMEEFEKI